MQYASYLLPLTWKYLFCPLCTAAAVCTFIFSAQGTLAFSSLQVLGVTDSKNFSFLSAKTNLVQKWPLNFLACSVKQSGWLAVQVFKCKDFLLFKIWQTPVGAPSIWEWCGNTEWLLMNRFAVIMPLFSVFVFCFYLFLRGNRSHQRG